MNDLLKLALDAHAHGGLDRWKKVKSIKVTASITGAIWYVKGKGDFLKNVDHPSLAVGAGPTSSIVLVLDSLDRLQVRSPLMLRSAVHAALGSPNQ
jgi:hypothetical protein